MIYNLQQKGADGDFPKSNPNFNQISAYWNQRNTIGKKQQGRNITLQDNPYFFLRKVPKQSTLARESRRLNISSSSSSVRSLESLYTRPKSVQRFFAASTQNKYGMNHGKGGGQQSQTSQEQIGYEQYNQTNGIIFQLNEDKVKAAPLQSQIPTLAKVNTESNRNVNFWPAPQKSIIQNVAVPVKKQSVIQPQNAGVLDPPRRALSFEQFIKKTQEPNLLSKSPQTQLIQLNKLSFKPIAIVKPEPTVPSNSIYESRFRPIIPTTITTSRQYTVAPMQAPIQRFKPVIQNIKPFLQTPLSIPKNQLVYIRPSSDLPPSFSIIPEFSPVIQSKPYILPFNYLPKSPSFLQIQSPIPLKTKKTLLQTTPSFSQNPAPIIHQQPSIRTASIEPNLIQNKSSLRPKQIFPKPVESKILFKPSLSQPTLKQRDDWNTKIFWNYSQGVRQNMAVIRDASKQKLRL